MKMTGAQMAVEALALEGVRCVFGIPGGAVLPLYDALREAPFSHILVRHEQAAAHAADGYARASGEPGVCICTSGPGFTNILTGLATAHFDSVPMVAITGQVATALLGTDAFQEADTFGDSLSHVKHCFLVRSPDDIPSVIRSAFEIAASGRPGPVVVELPVDIQRSEGEYIRPEKVLFARHRARNEENGSRMAKAARLLETAERPVILAGGGVIAGGAAQQLLRLAERLQSPVATTLMGKGAFPESHALSLGMAGMHGTPAANLALSDADVILGVGTRFSDRTTGKAAEFAKNAAVIHIDIDDAEIDKIVQCAVPLVGEAGAILAGLAETLTERETSEWAATTQKMKGDYPLADPDETDFLPSAIFGTLQQRLGNHWTAAVDVGQHQMWAALFWKAHYPRTFLTTGGLGTMGYALPAAMGASLAHGKTPVLCFAGDGGFMMNVQELETCARYQIPVKIFILNNDSLGMVRQLQDFYCNGRYFAVNPSSTCHFPTIARGFGVHARTCSALDELDDALGDLLHTPGPGLLDCRIPQEELVLPMVPAGAALKDFVYRVKERI